MKTSLYARTWLCWRCVLVTVAVIASLLSAGAALAQDHPAAEGDASSSAARLYLPLLLAPGNGGGDQGGGENSGLALDGNIDGAWYAPRNDLGETPVTCEFIDNSPDDSTNENFMRYGQPIGAEDCGAVLFRSGFGFDGSDVASFAPNQPFLLGRFTHYNNNIVTPLTPMQFVDLSLRFQSATPAVDVVMTYTMRLDETRNDGACPYGATNAGLCDDRVDLVNNTPRQQVIVDGAAYTLNILGFVPGAPESCQYSPTIADAFITGELAQNDACIFAEFVRPQPAIELVKSPDQQTIAAGDSAEFAITVRNTGNVGLSDVTVVDPATPDCAREVGDLKAGATLTYTCTAYDVQVDFENVATAAGLFAGTAYQATDTALVDVLAPDTATLFAYKYLDQDGNGQRDPAEPGLAGWSLCVRDGNGAPVGLCATTDYDGLAVLAPNQAGEFRVCEELRAGWANTDPVDGSGCKAVTVTQAPRYAELTPAADTVYGVALTGKSTDYRVWDYTLYRFLESAPPAAWVLALPACIDATQIDPVATTAGWSFVTDSVTGLRGLRWPVTTLPEAGAAYRLVLRQPYPTGAGEAAVISSGMPMGAAGAVAGPVCADAVLLGNRDLTGTGGTLEVRKVVLPANDDGRFDLVIDGIVVANGVGNGGTTGAQLVSAGTHTVVERAGAASSLENYQQSLRCIEAASGRAWTPGADGLVAVGVNEAVVCTFTNIRLGNITIVKQASATAPADWTFTGGLGTFTLPAAGGQRTFSQLVPGAYPVNEQPAAGWALRALTCVDPGFDSPIDLLNAAATINLAPGETVTCTFVNVAERGSITIVKTVNGSASAPWAFAGALGDFTLDAAGGARLFADLAPGAYAVRELAVENWRTSSITCRDPDDGTTTDLVSASAFVDLDAREDITCTFVNDSGLAAIALQKQASADVVYSNTPVTYTFAVNNLGTAPLTALRIDDPLCVVTPLLTGDANIGDFDRDGQLDVEETWRFACTVTLAADTTNTATAWGTAPWGEVVWDQASATVDVIAPALMVEKRADRAQVAAGEIVNFLIAVHNTGDEPLRNVTVVDDQPGCTLTSPAGDDGNGVLEPAERWTYTCTLRITADTVNTATALGYDRLNTAWRAAGSAAVTVALPAIELIKLADKSHVYPGETVAFTLTVRNRGEVRLQNIVVSDALPACQLSAPTGDDGDGQLAPGEAWVYTCTITACPGENFVLPDQHAPLAATLPVLAGATDALCTDITNRATVVAETPAGERVTDEESVLVDLIRPAIQVTKVADKTYVDPGELINFSIFVKNTGDTPLADVVVTDSMPECLVSGPAGDDGDQVLAPAEEWRYVCTAAVQVDTINTARAVASDPRGTAWWDEDSVAITVCLD